MSLPEVVLSAVETIRHLDPGSLAELRRMNATTGAAAFWRLATRYPSYIGSLRRQREWIDIIRIFAVLTPSGDPGERPRLHDPKRELGMALCDGGDPEWPGTDPQPRPMYSERRLCQLMATRGQQRGVMLTRAVRMLARSRAPDCGIRVVDVALAILKPQDGRLLAEPYYRRLDIAESKAMASQKGTT